MLQELHVTNFALIERLDLEFGRGLNILTGETGAGKSILIDAINAILGERTGVDVIRHGEERATVVALFDTDDANGLRARLDEDGYEDEDGLLLIGRELARAGQGVARVNGKRATVGILKSLGEGLVNLHGQHAHQTLLAPERHIDILDAWGGAEIGPLRGQIAELYRAWKALQQEMSRLQMDERERTRRIDLNAFQVDEINAAKPRAGEEEELVQDRARLAGAERLAAGANEAHEVLSGDAGSAVESLGTAMNRLRDVAKIDPTIADTLAAVETAFYTAQEAARDVAAYVESIEFNPERLAEVEDRLDTLRRLEKKYGDSIEEVLVFRDRIAAELAELRGADVRTEELQAEIEAARARLDRLNADLRARRREAGESLRRAMERELNDLAMEKTRFEVALEPIEPTTKGADRVEFLIAPNPGEPLKPLSRIASGGELSRLMLALKSVVAQADPVPVLIFDEIDVGVSGRVAGVIARKLKALAQTSQVLCVTHLPQIAAAADQHYLIIKATTGNRTTTQVARLDNEGRVEEIARMIAGTTPGETARTHARELIGEFHG